MNNSGPELILIGPPGAGKTTVGRMVARTLGIDFRDFDDEIEREHGMPAGELVVEVGRERFRELELLILKRILPERTGVLALGGGTPTSPGVAELLEPYHVVYLEVDLDNLLRREGLIPLHPWLLPNPRAHLRRLLAERMPIYTAVADVMVATSGRDPQDVAAEVLSTVPTSQRG
ncbi:MAG TPA: shikimate kinase [Pseudonocardiaceae bacterium]|jgi:shikimate kinase